MGAACGCNEKPNLIEEIKFFINDLVISKTYITTYESKLYTAIDDGTFIHKNLFRQEFLKPLLAVNNSNFSKIQSLVEDKFLKLSEQNPAYFIMSLTFLSETINSKTFKKNYDSILEDLPNHLTRVIKQKSELRVFKKFVKFYVRLITQTMLDTTENFFTRSQEEINEVSDLKIVYGNLYINEFIKNLFKDEKEQDFNLDKFLYIHYEDLKHFNVTAKIYEIFQMNFKNNLVLEKDIADLTDEFSEGEQKELDVFIAPDLIIENNNQNFLKEKKEEEIVREILIEEKIEEIEEKKIIKEISQKNDENTEEEFDDDIVECQPEVHSIEIDPKTANKIGDLINKHARGYLYRKKFEEKIRPQLEEQDDKIQLYIITKFTSEKIKKAENLKKTKFDNEGWKKFYTENREIEKINQDELIETKFTIFENKEYYAGTLNNKKQKHGFGVSIMRQGDKYQGYWYEDQYNGWGELIDKKGTIWYGQFSQGKLEGKGEKFMLDGNYYIGDFENFEKNITGREETEFYDYEGSFKNDKKHGKGRIFMRLLNDTYQGDFFNDAITGNGEYLWANKNNYIGEFLNGKMHGKGINTWPDGTRYEGEYVNGIKDGFGKYTKPNGKIYEGGFKEGKPHGLGKLISSKGTVDAEFKMGNIVKN